MCVHVLCMTLSSVLILTVGHDSITKSVCACAVYGTVKRSDTYSVCMCVCAEALESMI